MKKLSLIIAYVILVYCINAQDTQFTQFYASPLYLNPAFTGLTYEHRFAAAYRNQWPGIKRTYSSYMVSYDYNASELNSGIGGFVLQDVSGSTNLVNTQEGINLAYKVKTGKFSEARGGVMIAANQLRIDNSKLIFNDQLITGAAASQDAALIAQKSYFDMGIGGLFNSKSIWAGFAAKHINQPNTSLTGNVESLPVYLSLHGGYRYVINALGSNKTRLTEYVSMSFNYRHQSKYDQLDIGAYYFNKLINVGLWYRGLPFKRYKSGYPEQRRYIDIGRS